MIYIEVSESEFRDALKNDPYAKWSEDGIAMLYEILSDFEEDIELDVTAIRCDYSEYLKSEYSEKELLKELSINSLDDINIWEHETGWIVSD